MFLTAPERVCNRPVTGAVLCLIELGVGSVLLISFAPLSLWKHIVLRGRVILKTSDSSFLRVNLPKINQPPLWQIEDIDKAKRRLDRSQEHFVFFHLTVATELKDFFLPLRLTKHRFCR